MSVNGTINVVFAGLGGQGVLKASTILGQLVHAAGHDVKKSELHGMSQRGGSVTSDVRFGREVFSPMVPEGAAHYVVVFAEEEVENSKRFLGPDGVLIAPELIDQKQLASKRSLNIALLGVLSNYLDISEDQWLDAIRANLPAKVHPENENAFQLGRGLGRAGQSA